MPEAVYFVTGSMGCLGAWTLYHLQRTGKRAIGFDLSADRARLHLLLSPEAQNDLVLRQGDLTDFAQVRSAMAENAVTHVIHLAALQVRHVTYASSVAVYSNASDYPYCLLPHDAPLMPRTLYGVYKQANEGTARLYWQDHGSAARRCVHTRSTV